jgi:hypothetical protein
MPSKTVSPDKADGRRAVLTLILSQGYSAEERNANLRRMTEGLSDVEWKRVNQYGQFPDERGRYEINKLLAFYWQNRVDEWIPDSIATKVQVLSDKTNGLMLDLKNVSNDHNFYKGIFAEYKRSPADYERELEIAYDQLSRLQSVLWDAKFRLLDGVSRASYGPVSAAIRNLDAVTHLHHPSGLSFSKKKPCGINFVLEVIAVIDAQVKPGYVETILKGYLAQRKRWGGVHAMVGQGRN